MIPQVQGDTQNQLEEKQSQTHGPQSRKLPNRDNRYHRLPNPRHFNVNIICSLLMAIGLILIVLGKFLHQNTFMGFLIENSGWVAFLIGIAMFSAIIKTTLEV